MGVIAKQALRNAQYILLGTILGALNNILVLPRAFEDFKSGLGFIVLIVSLAAIFSQFLSFSSHNILVNFSSKLTSDAERNKLATKFLIACSFGSILLVIGILIGDNLLLSWLSPVDATLMSEHFIALIVLTSSLIFYELFTGYLKSRYKSVLINALNDPVLKGGYLIIALLYWQKIIDYNFLLYSFVGLYLLATIIVYIYSRALGYRLKMPTKSSQNKTIIEYGVYSILDKSAGIFVHRLDILMVSFILDLSFTAEYAIAFYVGSVVSIPFKSIGSIAHPIISKELGNNNIAELNKILKSSTLYSITGGAFLFAVIWINITPIFDILPEKFGGGIWVVFFIGLSKLVHMTGGVNGAIILFSNHYRFNLILNLSLVILTFITNLILIPIYNIVGAASATLISLLIFSMVRIVYVKIKFSIHPFSKELLLLFFFMALLILGFNLLPRFFGNNYIEIIVKSLLFGSIYMLLLKIFNIIPELKTLSSLKKFLKGG